MSDIKYTEIKVRDLGTLLKTGNTTTNAENNLANNQGKLWGNLLGSLESTLDWTSLENMNNGDDVEAQKAIRKAIQDHLKQRILKEEGVSLMKGEKGNVLWSKDPKTAPIMKYTSDIAKIVTAGMSSELLPGDGTVAARCDILKACKAEKSALELIKLAMAAIDNAMTKATPQEHSAILAEFQGLSVHIAAVQ